MKVVSARIYLVDIDGRRPVILEVMTDDGTTGIGEAAVAYGAGATAAAAMKVERTDRVRGEGLIEWSSRSIQPRGR